MSFRTAREVAKMHKRRAEALDALKALLPENPKPCETCRHYEYDDEVDDDVCCNDKMPGYWTATYARGKGKPCGPAGTLWEPKKKEGEK